MTQVGLESLLNPRSACYMIGEEIITRVDPPIEVWHSEYGSYRYVLLCQGEVMSCLQIVSRDGKTGRIAQVYTREGQRRKGFASRLYRLANEDFNRIDMSTDVSEAGDAFQRSLQR
jgi:hypothetical protein